MSAAVTTQRGATDLTDKNSEGSREDDPDLRRGIVVRRLIAPVLAGVLTKLTWGGDPNASWRWALLAVMTTALLSGAVSFFCARDSRSPEGSA